MKKKWLLLCNIIMMVCIVVNVACLGIFLHEKKSLKVKNATKVENSTATEGADTGADDATLSEKGGAFIVDENVTFTLTEGAVISGHKNRYGAAIYVFSGGTFILDGGLITRNEGKFGTIYVEDGGTLILNRGEITGNYGQLAFRDEELDDYGIYLENPENLKLGDGTKAYTEKTFTQVEYTDERYSEIVHDNPYKLYEYTINYYVGTTIEAIERIDPIDAVLTLDGAPLTYEESMGYFVEDEYINGAEIGMTLSVNNVQSLAANTTNNVLYSDKYGTINLYTKKATLDKLSFTLNSTVNKYSVKAKDSSITGEVVIPREYNGKEVYEIPSSGFSSASTSNTKITGAFMPVTIRVIGSHAFISCESLSFVNLPEGVNSIGSATFINCNIKTLRIPSTITSIDSTCFGGCGNSLEKIESYNTKYTTSLNGAGENILIDTESKTVMVGCNSSVIPEGILTIGNSAFFGCSKLTGVAFPKSLLTIGVSSFNRCSALSALDLSNSSIQTVGHSAFYGCAALNDINFNGCSSLTTVGNNAFQGCLALNDINFNGCSSLTTVGNNAFYSCSALNDINFNGCSSLTTVGNNAFYGCSALTAIEQNDFKDCAALETVSFKSSGIKEIQDSAFNGLKNLSSIDLSDCAITTIGNSAFSSCSALGSITIPDSVTSIGTSAFADCDSLSSFSLPESITEIKYRTFYDCVALTSIKMPTSLTTIGGYAFAYCEKLTDIEFPDSLRDFIEFPDTLTTIGENAFRQCKGLEEMLIPSSVTSIGDYAFYQCTGLTWLYYNANTTSLSSTVFNGCSNIQHLLIYGSLKGTSKDLFGGCGSLIGLTVHTQLAETAFHSCSTIESIGVGSKEISKYAFSQCTGLESVSLEDTVESIAGSTETLKDVNNTPNDTTDDIVEVTSYAFSGCSAITSLDIRRTGDVAYAHKGYFANLPNVTKVYLNCNARDNSFAGLTKLQTVYTGAYGAENTVGVCAFAECVNLTEVAICNTTEIKAGAFMLLAENDADLNRIAGYSEFEIDIWSLSKINDWAFANRKNLKSIKFKDGLTSIGANAFCNTGIYETKGFNYLRIPASVTSIGEQAFFGCKSLQRVMFVGESKLTKISKLMFANSGLVGGRKGTSYTPLIIPKSVTKIEQFAFLNCTALEGIVIPESVTSVAVDDASGVNKDEIKEGAFIGTATGLLAASAITLAATSSKVGAVVGGVGGAAVGFVAGYLVGCLVESMQGKYTPFWGCSGSGLYIYVTYDKDDDLPFGWTYWGSGLTDCYSFEWKGIVPGNGHLIDYDYSDYYD